MILAALMIPGQVTLVPLYLMITKLELINTFLGRDRCPVWPT